VKDLSQKIKDFIEKLRSLEEQQKKAILWSVVILLGVIMGIFWIRGAINNLQKIGENMGQIEFPEIQSSKTSDTTTDQTLDWKTYTNEEYSFEIKYPSDWTYQKFSCNLDGIAFCPLIGNNVLNCGQTCDMNSPESPIYFYMSSQISSQSLKLWDNQYIEIYEKMILTFKFIQ